MAVRPRSLAAAASGARRRLVSTTAVPGPTPVTFELQSSKLVPARQPPHFVQPVHDGEYNQWRHRASGVTEPFQTVPGQVIEGMQLALTRGATVRGKVVDVLCRPKPHTQVRAISTDDRDNRYYVPTTRTDEQGNYELKFIRAGEQRIQTDPFWLAPNQAPTKSSRTLTLKAGEEIEGVELVSHE